VNILVIEDDASVRRAMSRILTTAGHRVVEAENGAVGLRLVRDEDFHLVVTDILMPEKEGIETIMELRERLPGLKILAVSGGFPTDREGTLADAEALGADASLAKPFSVEEFKEAVERLIRET